MYRNTPISEIRIDREGRQRRELEDIPNLAASIAQIGLINAIVIDQDKNLVAGERRLEACRSLGWDTVPTQLREDLDPRTAQLLELEENVKRHELPWKDECFAVFNYHNLRVEANPEHTVELTALELSMHVNAIYQRLEVQKALLSGNELVVKADKFSVARNLVSRANERKKAAELETISVNLGGALEEPATFKEPETFVEPSAPIFNVDFIDWVQAYSGPRFNLIHCDFPYGINADKHHQGAAKYYRGYADTPDVYWTLIAALGDNIEKLCAESAHLIFWYSMDYHTETRMALEQMGWKVNPFPLVWFKSDNTGILPDPNRGPRRVYETAFFASRGDRKIVQPVSNCFPAPVIKTVHMSQKSLPMLQHFFRMTVDEHTHLLDPTCGSGSALQAADALGAQRLVGLERDPEIFEESIRYWKEQNK